MSRQIQIHYYCDNEAAGHEPRTTEGDTYSVYDEVAKEVKEVDMCDPCMVDMSFTRMQDIVQKYGRKQTEPEVDPELVCPYTDCERHTVPFKDKGGRRRHLTRTHNEAPASEDSA